MTTIYNEDYYRSVNYYNYLERGERYIQLAQETTHLLKQLKLIDDNSNILDFGCAVGHLLNGLRKSGIRDLEGCEISDWATQEAKNKGFNVSKTLRNKHYDVIYFLDVLEHIDGKTLDEIFSSIRCSCIIFRIPVIKKLGEDYVLSVSRKDPTHVTRRTKTQWTAFFKQHGFGHILNLNLHTIYDTTGVFSGIAIKNKLE
jgi:2-polyprenyl-3-methyl-5-hydroxy-6-metoxy-1,4-benzoquinol methylase